MKIDELLRIRQLSGLKEAETSSSWSQSQTVDTTQTTGGGTTTQSTSPAMAAWSQAKLAAQQKDSQATQAAMQQFLAAKGLQNATPAQRRAALAAGRTSGEFKDVTANVAALPPAPTGAAAQPVVSRTAPAPTTTRTVQPTAQPDNDDDW
jgi:hypothetical protein